MTTMANKAIKDLFDIANGNITADNVVSAVTKVRLYEAAGNLAFKLSIHQSKSGKRVRVPFFDDEIEVKVVEVKEVIVTPSKPERKDPVEHTKVVPLGVARPRKFVWTWLHDHVKELEVNGRIVVSFKEAQARNPGSRYQDLQNGLLNVFNRHFILLGYAPDSFKFTTKRDLDAEIVIIKRTR